MTREDLERLLDDIQQNTSRIAKNKLLLDELEKNAKELRAMIEADSYGVTLMRERILDALGEPKEEPVEEPDPNADPEEVPPVTDMEEVKNVVKSGGKSKRIFMRNMETGVEKEFPSKTRAAQFLDITQQYLAMLLKEDRIFKGWKITVADSPTA